MHDLVNCLQFDMNRVNNKVRDFSRAQVIMSFLHALFEYITPATQYYNDNHRKGGLRFYKDTEPNLEANKFLKY